MLTTFATAEHRQTAIQTRSGEHRRRALRNESRDCFGAVTARLSGGRVIIVSLNSRTVADLPRPSSNPATSLPQPAPLNPLEIDLEQRATSLGEDLGIQIPQRGAELLSSLSSIASRPGGIAPVARRFAPVLLDIVARWLDGADEAGDRLAAISDLAEPRPDLWP